MICSSHVAGSQGAARHLGRSLGFWLFFFTDTATTEIYTLSLHDALPISATARSRARCRPSRPRGCARPATSRSEEHTSELQSQFHLVCRLLLEKKNRHPDDRIETQPINAAQENRPEGFFNAPPSSRDTLQ